MTTTTASIPTWTLQDRMVKARHFAHMSQMKLSEASGVPFKTLQRIERGETTSSVAVLIGLASILGVDADWLINGTVTPDDIHRLNDEYNLIAA